MTKLPAGLDFNPLEDTLPDEEPTSPKPEVLGEGSKQSLVKVLRDYRKYPTDSSLHVLKPGVTVHIDVHDGAYFQLALTGRFSRTSEAVSALFKDIQALQDTIHPQLLWIVGELFALLVNGGDVENLRPERSPTIIRELSRTILKLMSKVPAFASLMVKCKGSVFLTMTAMRGVVKALKDLEIPSAEYPKDSPYRHVPLFEDIPASDDAEDPESESNNKSEGGECDSDGPEGANPGKKSKGKSSKSKKKNSSKPSKGSENSSGEGTPSDPGESGDSSSSNSNPGKSQKDPGQSQPFDKLTDWIDKHSPRNGKDDLMSPSSLKSLRALDGPIAKANSDVNQLIELSKMINRPDRGWGSGSIKPQRVTDEALAGLAEKLAQNPNLQHVLEFMGRMLEGIHQQRDIVLERMGRSPFKASHEPTGNPLHAIISQQAMMADEDLELLFLKHAADNNLRKPASLEEQLDQKGGIAVYCDLSGSMYGLPSQTALAFAGAMCILCSQSGRPFAAAAFDTDVAVFDFDEGASPIEVALQVCSVTMGGGTDFNPVFRHFLSQPQEFLQKSDMVLLSDGIGPLDASRVKEFMEQGTRLFYIVIGTLDNASPQLLKCAKDSGGMVFVARSLDPQDPVLLEAAASALVGKTED